VGEPLAGGERGPARRRGRGGKGVGKLRRAGEPVGGVGRQRLGDDQLDLLRHGAAAGAEGDDRVARRLAGEHLVEDQAERVQVIGGGTVAGGAGQGRDAAAAGQADALGAHVMAHDAPGVRRGERGRDVGGDAEGLGDGEPSLAVEPGPERLARRVGGTGVLGHASSIA
jgi:hypothetical protein